MVHRQWGLKMKRLSALRGAAAAFVLVSGLGIGAGAALSAAVPASGTIPFTAFRNGDSELGFHRLSFTREGEDLIMEKEIGFKVKLAFITAYRYEHRNREVWRDGKLISIDTQTNDDGKQHWVRGRATAEGFAVESSRGNNLAPADIISTSYWNIALTRATQLLDTQRGLVMDVRVEPKGVEPIEAGGKVIEARHFRINLLSNRPGKTEFIDIWYDDNDAWVKLAFQAGDQSVTYRLEPEGLVSHDQAAALPAASPAD